MRLTIFDIDNWKEIGATLVRNKTRTFLTGFGIFWGVAMLALLTGGARGGEDMLRRNFAGFSTNSGALVAERTTMPYRGHQKGRAWNLDFTDVELIRQAVPELDKVVGVSMAYSVSMVNGKNSYSGSAQGVEPELMAINEPKIYAGRYVNAADVSNERKVASIGKKVASELFPDDPEPLGKTFQMNGVSFSVIGVIGDLAEVSIGNRLDESIVIPASTFRRAFNRGNQVDLICVTAKDGEKLSKVIPKMRALIYRRHNIDPNDESAMYAMDISERFEQIDMLFTGVDLLALFIGLSTLLAGVIGIGNIMWVIVKERTQELGIRRAIGAKPSDIVVQILSEGSVLTLVAGMAGICFATLILGIVHHTTNGPEAVSEAHFQMSFSGAVVIMLIFLVLGMLAGLIPSIKAMRIKPVEAINDK